MVDSPSSGNLLVLISLSAAAALELAFGLRFDQRWLGVLVAVQLLSVVRCLLIQSRADNDGTASPVSLRHRFRSWLTSVLTVGIGAFAVGMSVVYLTFTDLQQPLPVVQRAVCGILVLQACYWLVLRASLTSIAASVDEGIQARRLVIRATLTEQTVLSLIAATGAAAQTVAPAAMIWFVRAAAAWGIALTAEIGLRVGFGIARREPIAVTLGHPLFVQQLLNLNRSEVIGDEGSESRDLSPHTVASFRSALLGAVGIILVSAWLTTGVVLVPIGSTGLYARLGRLTPEPLTPGLHFTLPVPFGSVTTLDTGRPLVLPLGFRSDSAEVLRESFLWTRPHSGEEYPILIGTGAEAVVVNGFVRCRIGDDPDSLRDYVSSAQSPEAVVRRLAHQALLEELRGLGFDAAVGAQRVQLAEKLQHRIRRAAEPYRLGLEILDCSILSVHPPIEAAAAYLDIVSAHTEAAKQSAVARAAAEGELERCRMMSDTTVADARANAARRLTSATEQTTRFAAQAEVYAAAPQVVRARLLADTLGATLAKRPFVLLDAYLPPTVRLVFDETATARDATNK